MRIVVGCLVALLLLAHATVAGAQAPDAAPLPVAAALRLFEVPAPADIDAIQRAIDVGWPADIASAAFLGTCLARNAAALEAFRAAADTQSFDLFVDDPRNRDLISRLRLAIGLTLLDGQRALSEGRADAAARDVRTLAAAAQRLVEAPATVLRIVGCATVVRVAALARKAGCAPLALTLPSRAALVGWEKARYLEAAERSSAIDGALAPHVRAAAAKLAATFYDPLAEPLTLEAREALAARFEALYADLGSRYARMDPRSVVELLPSPPPPPASLGAALAGLVLCARYLDARTLVRVHGEACAVLGQRP